VIKFRSALDPYEASEFNQMAAAELGSVCGRFAAGACGMKTPGRYIPAHNAQFAVRAEQEVSAFVAITGVDRAEILCVQEERQVGNDNTVVFHTLRLQILPSPLRGALRRGAGCTSPSGTTNECRLLVLSDLQPALTRRSLIVGSESADL
jgi:hypothetical protein